MRTTIIRFLTLVAFASSAAVAGMLEIGTVQLRATAPGMGMTGGYVTITNNGESDERLVAVSAGFAKRVELHEMIHDNGVMKMRERDGGIEIPAGETVMLKPGGLHIMFMGLGETMVPGEMREITLEFASGLKATVPAMVIQMRILPAISTSIHTTRLLNGGFRLAAGQNIPASIPAAIPMASSSTSAG